MFCNCFWLRLESSNDHFVINNFILTFMYTILSKKAQNSYDVLLYSFANYIRCSFTRTCPILLSPSFLAFLKQHTLFVYMFFIINLSWKCDFFSLLLDVSSSVGDSTYNIYKLVFNVPSNRHYISVYYFTDYEIMVKAETKTLYSMTIQKKWSLYMSWWCNIL